MRKRRHWLRGVVGGLLVGIGLALAAIIFAFNPLGVMTPWVMLVLGLVLGVALVFVPAPGTLRRRPPRTTAQS